MLIALPTALTPPAVLIALWVLAASDRASAAAAGAVAAASLAGSYAIWVGRGRRWHDGLAILSLLPAVAAGVWVAVGGLALGEHESTARRLLVEVGPGLALVGIAATILGYHGRHDPREAS